MARMQIEHAYDLAMDVSSLSVHQQSDVRDRWLAERLDEVVPLVMRRVGLDAWVLIAREYNEDPVVRTMLPATWVSAPPTHHPGIHRRR